MHFAVSGANAKEATPVTTEQLVGTDPVEGPPLPFALEADDKEYGFGVLAVRE